MPMKRFLRTIREHRHMAGRKLERFFSNANFIGFGHALSLSEVSMKEKQSHESVIVITGAGKGIGRAVAESLSSWARNHRNPVKILLTSRTRSDLEALKSRIESDSIECDWVSCDLADSPTRPLEVCIQRFGRVDALIHCAGVGRFKEFLEQTEDDVEYTIRTNVTATFLLLQRAYAIMKAQAPRNGMRGQIQVVTSIAAEQPFLQSSSYCMSKYAQRGLLDVMKLYGRQDGIRILEVKPGAAYTPMWGEVEKGQLERMMSPEDVAHPMVEALSLSPRASLESVTIRPIGGDL
jgi:sepiapterin reductase